MDRACRLEFELQMNRLQEMYLRFYGDYIREKKVDGIFSNLHKDWREYTRETERIESAEGKDEIIRSRLPETKSLCPCKKIGKSRKIIPVWGLSTRAN